MSLAQNLDALQGHTAVFSDLFPQIICRNVSRKIGALMRMGTEAGILNRMNIKALPDNGQKTRGKKRRAPDS